MKLARLIHAVELDGGGLDVAAGASLRDAAGGELTVNGLFYRAQEVTPGGAFIAIKGYAADGHDYIGQAMQQGASAVFCERIVPGSEHLAIPVLDGRMAMAALAAEYYGHPSRAMTVMGITGTSGKTTVSYLIESILKSAGLSVGVIGTINYRYDGKCFDNPVTTPESLDLQRILAEMEAAGVTHVVMEISSHALDLNRVHACDVDVALFTNLSQDHLDFHDTMESYWSSKQRLFTHVLPSSKGRVETRAVINIDDPRGNDLADTLAMPLLSTGKSETAEIRVGSNRIDPSGIEAVVHTPGGELKIRSALVGHHNLENILNAIGAAVALGIDGDAIKRGIKSLENVPGRLERVDDPKGGRFICVDYAHKPDALEKTLTAVRAVSRGRIISVFGCGGDRDRAKRPLMGQIAARLSDLTVVTSDNPRTEPPESIIEQIVKGVSQVCDRRYRPEALNKGFNEKGYVVVPDRREAIALGIRAARPGDTVLIAGKGHEPYQIVGKEKFPFDDRIEAKTALGALTIAAAT